MEEKFLKLVKLADELNERQDKVYAEIEYTANDSKKLVISIRSKKDFSYIEKCEVQLNAFSMIEWDNVIIAEPTKLYYTSKDGSIHKNSDFQQELNLAYVAATRSRKTLDASIIITELEEFGIDTKLNTFKVDNGKEVLMKTEVSA